MNEGAELDTIPDTKDFDISKKVADYKELKGNLYACGTCLELRQRAKAKYAPSQRWRICSKWLRKVKKLLVFG